MEEKKSRASRALAWWYMGLVRLCHTSRVGVFRRAMAPQPILLSPSAVAKHGIKIRANESAFRENSATIVMPSKEAAFLNPVQEFNRDLSTIAIITWSKILDCEKRQRFDARMKARSKRSKTSEPDAKRLKTGTYDTVSPPR